MGDTCEEDDGSWASQRLRALEVQLALARTARARALEILEKVIHRTFPGCVCVVQGSAGSGMDHPSSDLDVLVCPGDGDQVGSKLLRALAKAKRILQTLRDALPFQAALCLLCNRHVSPNRICTRAGLSLCGDCSGGLTETALEIIASYDPGLSAVHWANQLMQSSHAALERAFRGCEQAQDVSMVCPKNLLVPLLTLVVNVTPQQKIPVDVMIADDLDEATRRKDKIVRHFSPEERIFAPPLVLLLKDVLHHHRLDETYTGGLGGYATVALVFAFLRNHPHTILPTAPCMLTHSSGDARCCEEDNALPEQKKRRRRDASRSSTPVHVVEYCGKDEKGHWYRVEKRKKYCTQPEEGGSTLLEGGIRSGDAREGTAEVDLEVPRTSLVDFQAPACTGDTLDALLIDICAYCQHGQRRDGDAAWFNTVGGVLELEDPEDPDNDLGKQVYRFPAIQGTLGDLRRHLLKQSDIKTSRKYESNES